MYGPGPWVETRLSELFTLATRWNSISLLDEADVFMQQRNLHSLDTNQLVPSQCSVSFSLSRQRPNHKLLVLLRVLEYFEGILFLTTNRAESIDQAFKSRIHLAIAYPTLSADARCALWDRSIVRANRGQSPEWLTIDILDHLVKKKVNGREIRNIVRMGHALARNANRDMECAHILQGLDAWEHFEADSVEWPEQKHTPETKGQVPGLPAFPS